MPSDHISNTDYHKALDYGFYVDYEAVRLQKMKLQCRCSSHRTGLELALAWLKENTDLHEATTISNLSEKGVWKKIKLRED
tara:strand:- start:85 stop:327 length:243 start_codon:yes stop_codon:yes gene_type:complete